MVILSSSSKTQYTITHTTFLYCNSYLKDLIPAINKVTTNFIEKLKSLADTQTPTKIMNEFSLCTLEVIGMVCIRKHTDNESKGSRNFFTCIKP